VASYKTDRQVSQELLQLRDQVCRGKEAQGLLRGQLEELQLEIDVVYEVRFIQTTLTPGIQPRA
jgi:hypothetical protein